MTGTVGSKADLDSKREITVTIKDVFDRAESNEAPILSPAFRMAIVLIGEAIWKR